MPRPEIDLVALKVSRNELLLVEAKSYLDSYGVYYEAVCTENDQNSYRYSLVTKELFRNVVTKRLKEEYVRHGLIYPDTRVNNALAAGNIHSGNESALAEHFSEPERGWMLFTPSMIKKKIRDLSGKGYEDNLITVTAKLTLRNE